MGGTKESGAGRLFSAQPAAQFLGVVNNSDQPEARLVETGLAGGFVLACAGALSHPPAGPATLTASSGCDSTAKVWTASLAPASDWASRRLAIASRLRDAASSPWAVVRLPPLHRA